jgi:hypothetical protein
MSLLSLMLRRRSPEREGPFLPQKGRAEKDSNHTASHQSFILLDISIAKLRGYVKQGRYMINYPICLITV